MKVIQRPLFFFLWSAKFALSQTDGPLPTDLSFFPSCIIQGRCLAKAALISCARDLTMGCACQRKASEFFNVFSSCATSVCSGADATKAIDLVVGECAKYGYNPKPISGGTLTTPTPTILTLHMTSSTVLDSLDLTTQTTLPGSSNLPVSGTTTPPVTGATTLPVTGTTTSNPTSTPTPSKATVMSTAAIIGIVVGGVAVVGIIAVLIVLCMRHRVAMATVSQQPQQPPPGYPPPREPLVQEHNGQEHPASGYYADHKEANVELPPAPTTAATTLAPVTPGHQGQSFQELPVQQRPIQGVQELAQEGSEFVEMPGDNRGR